MHKRMALILVILLLLSTTGCQQIANKSVDSVFYGTAEMEQLNISSELAGVINEIKAAEGEKIGRDNVIATLNAPESAIRSEQAALAIKMAENEQQRVEDMVVRGKETAKEAAELGVEQAKLNYELSKLAVEKVEIKAATEGIVDTINYSAGEYVLPGSPIATILNPQNMWVRIYVPEKTLAQINLNQEVSLTSDFIEGEVKGRISYISSKAEYTPMNVVTKKDREKLVFEVKITLVDNSDKIKAGMLLDVHL